jgi:NAD-dependent SIR2 family protein deacetylase
MENHIITYIVSKYVKEHKLNISSISDPILLNETLLNIKKKISITVKDVVEFNKKENRLCLDSYNFWLREIDTGTTIEDITPYSFYIEIEKAKMFLKKSNHILISCGAGMSTSSGLPCFFGKDGVWNTIYDINTLYSTYDNTIPEEAYFKLLNFSKKHDSFVFTSNIDNLFIKAGFDRHRLCECHGNYSQKQCNKCNIIFENKNCPTCGTLGKENVLKYSDTKNFCSERLDSQEKQLTQFLKNKNICILELGCGINTPTVRDYNEILVEDRSDITLIRVNPIHWYVPEKIQNKSSMIKMSVNNFLDIII